MKSNNMLDELTTNPEDYNIRVLSDSNETIAVFPLFGTTIRSTNDNKLEVVYQGFRVFGSDLIYEKKK